MKIILKPTIKEESVCHCDLCGTEAVAWLQFVGGYGSEFDMLKYCLDLCNVHAIELLNLLKEKYPKIQEKELNFTENPWNA